jgi:hypothetical protein
MTKSLYYNVAELDLDRALDYARDFNAMLRQTKPAAASAFAGKAKA